MIQILIVDDSPEKIADISRAIEELFLGDAIAVQIVGDVATASAAMQTTFFDLVILDLNIPMRRQELPASENGLHLLQLIERNTGQRFRVPAHIIGLTEFKDLLSTCNHSFSNWHLLHYSRSISDWRIRLCDKLLHIVASAASNDGQHDTDLAIVTALDDVELESILALPASWQPLSLLGDSTVYHRGAFSREGKTINVVAAAALEMGMPATAALVVKVINQFHPKYLAMGGIAAGVKGVGNIGDVLVADSAFDLGSGKRKRDGSGSAEFLPAPYAIPLDPSLKAKLTILKHQADLLHSVRVGWPDPPSTELKVHIGPFASGAAVIADENVVKEILGSNRKLIGLDMETYAVFVAARFCVEPRPIPFSAKSICDFADSSKVDKYQRYAAYTSSRLIYELALRYF